MKLLYLALDHFKGVNRFEFAPNGHDADIYGDNGTGKTTIADAYFWLLFGKDSSGSSNFDILPRDEMGHVVDGLEASVTGKFTDDAGGTFTLRRVYHQVFTRKNGEAERKFKGNTTEFYINDVPKPQKEYNAFVAGLCEEKTFRLLTDPDMFAGKLKWNERRDMLIQAFAPNLDDREIINAHKELQPLGGYIGFKSVDEYVEITKAQRRKINDELRGMPERIDEAEKAKPVDLPEPSDGPAMARLQKQKIKLESEISALLNGESLSAIRRQISEIQAEISKASVEYNRRTTAGNAGIEAEAAKLRAEIAELSGKIASTQTKLQSDEEFINRMTKEMDDLREQGKQIFEQELNPEDNICPTCGQEFPPDKQEQILNDFNEQKARKLREISEKGKSLKSTRDSMVQDAAELKQQLEEDSQKMKSLQSRLDHCIKQYVKPAPFESTDEFHELNRKLQDAQKQLETVLSASGQRETMLKEQIKNVSADLDQLKKRALNKEIAARQDKRIEELKQREKELSGMLATYDKGLQLAEQFTQQKAKDIEEKVNSAFQLVRWKLFDMQVNGGIKPCCEATVNGIEYGTNLNSAARLNAGLDIINTLSGVFGKSVPVWIDNAESITQYFPIQSQVIRLHVSASDRKLRVKVKE
jgi:DNA repair exonuclease SbcCD ATPase subunit